MVRHKTTEIARTSLSREQAFPQHREKKKGGKRKFFLDKRNKKEYLGRARQYIAIAVRRKIV
jgi:hypothetical protein